MATDNESLVLSISADTRQIQRQLKQLIGQTERDTKSIENAFGGIDKAATGAFGRVAANGNSAFKAAELGAKRFGSAMETSKVQTANLAAQLNDISVQLAGGQSPFQIALQQGTQITQALGSQAGVRGAVSAVAGAFTSLLNPVSLATIGIIALGGTAIQYFTELLSSGEQTEETLQKQAQLIQQVADRWGDAVPALREYADELKRTQDSASLQEGVAIVNEKKLADVRKAVDDTKVKVADVVAQLQAAGEEAETITALQSSFNDFAKSAKDGSLQVEQVQKVTDALATAINNTGLPIVVDFKTAFEELGKAALGAATGVNQVKQQAAAARLTSDNLPALGTLAPLQSVNGQITADSVAIQNDRANAAKSQYQQEKEREERLASRSRGKGGRSQAISEAEREKKAVVDLIEQLEFEQSMVGKTAAERAEANALRRAGSAATEEQRAKISQLVEATYAERDAIRASEEAMEQLRDVSRDVLEGLVSDLREGKSGADILANALDRVADRLLDSVFDNLFSGATGRTGKGLFGGSIIPGILHDGGVAGRDGYGHGRRVPTSVFASAPRYHTGGIAGLKPDEVPAILQRGERVIPRGGGSPAGGDGIKVDVGVTVDQNGNLQAFVKSISDASAAGVVKRYDRDSYSRTIQHIRKGKSSMDLK
ncbi:tail length tape measure protein [Neorhizobium sp. R1-B]|uniref:phage tail length tape measure family protein n=1 Tax=Neorhizobium sp. R1-B TaxID=2485162 RepID=UPI0010664014|nr:phage tail length tape measure family protein [Neorhizobium sp. R1-B]TDX77739.1 tail length tape measure protein [Neorhizobium sp. R1-B]